ncbi:predicted protein [Postia placenta Mad-698-R]|nr:predicted protein [Postia placenta Mad-698-R]
MFNLRVLVAEFQVTIPRMVHQTLEHAEFHKFYLSHCLIIEVAKGGPGASIAIKEAQGDLHFELNAFEAWLLLAGNDESSGTISNVDINKILGVEGVDKALTGSHDGGRKVS